MTIAKTLGVAFTAVALLASPAAADTAQSQVASNQVAGDIVDVAAKAGSFKTLIAAAKAAGLVDALKGKGPLTVFAPTDAAFAKLPKGTVASLLKPENKAKLQAILKYHVIAGAVPASAIMKAGKASAKTLQGQEVTAVFDKATKSVTVNGAKVIAADVKASNGIIHVIDTVILPK
jgi:uncharacterized surface protein with fasciclin (FAS1) repeats